MELTSALALFGGGVMVGLATAVSATLFGEWLGRLDIDRAHAKMWRERKR